MKSLYMVPINQYVDKSVPEVLEEGREWCWGSPSCFRQEETNELRHVTTDKHETETVLQLSIQCFAAKSYLSVLNNSPGNTWNLKTKTMLQ